MPSRNRTQLKSFIRFQLSQLSARNAHHEFENLAFEVARVRVVPNLLPATGPVQAGGDQGRDFESYRTYLANSSLGTSAFATKASDNIVVGACSLQKNIAEKIKADLGSIFGAGTRPEHIAYFCEVDVPVAKRHGLQDFCREAYDASLDVFDGQALAEILAERDTFWIAEQYLSIPADEWPEESTNERYRDLRARWVVGDERPQNYADFLDIKQGLRTATFDEPSKPDILSWLALMRDFVADGFSDRLAQKARYEISVAELRGRGSLNPALSCVEVFFEHLSDGSSASELMDGALLCVYSWGAIAHLQASIPLERAIGWKDKVDNILKAALSNTARVVDRCALLEAKATLSPVSPERDLTSPNGTKRFFDAWGAVVKQIQKTPYYPVKQVANILELVTPLLGTHPRFRPIADDVDELVAERAGSGAAAEQARRRAVAHLKAKRNIAALNELQKAKVGWFSGETMDGSILSMLVISQSLSKLNLNFAARYYAAGALFIALKHDDDRVKQHIAEAHFELAGTFVAAGEGITYIYALANALDAHHALASDPHDWTKHPHVQTSVAQAVALRAAALHLDRAIVPLIDEAMSSWPLPDDEKTAFKNMSEEPPWRDMTREEVEAKIAEELGQHPFGDVGRRSASWSAMGITWAVTGNPSPECWLAVSEVATILQLAIVEFADVDIVVIPSNVMIEVELQDAKKPSIIQLPDNGKLVWRIRMPADYLNDDHAFDLAVVAITILGQATALPFDEFRKLTEKRFERGLSTRFFSVRPIRELLAFVQPPGIPFAVLSNTTRRPLLTRLVPLESPELKWISSPGPNYSRKRADKYIRNRYERTNEALALTLPKLIRDVRCSRIIQDLRNEGLLDWQILNIIGSIVVQYQVQQQFPGKDLGVIAKEMQDRIYRREQEDDPKFDLNAFTIEVVSVQKKTIAISALRTWGLEIHRQTPDFEATKKLLDVRYWHSTDDLPHEDPFVTR